MGKFLRAVVLLDTRRAAQPDRPDPRRLDRRALRRGRPQHDGTGPVAHLHHIDDLAAIFRQPQRIEEQRTGLGADNNNRARVFRPEQAGCDHQRIGEAGAGLAQLDMRA